MDDGCVRAADMDPEKRGRRSVRHADDRMVSRRSERAARRACESVTGLIGGGLFPKANGGETCTARFDEAEYLGYALYGRDGRCRLRAHPKPVEAVRGRIGELAARGNAIPNGCRPRATTWSVRGRADYFRLADTRSLPQRTGKWMRRRVRKVCRKQRKRAHAAQDAQEMRN